MSHSQMPACLCKVRSQYIGRFVTSAAAIMLQVVLSVGLLLLFGKLGSGLLTLVRLPPVIGG